MRGPTGSPRFRCLFCIERCPGVVYNDRSKSCEVGVDGAWSSKRCIHPLGEKEPKRTAGPWSTWLIHDCGWRNQPSMGNVWFTSTEYDVCPKCGESIPYDNLSVRRKEGWRLVTARLVRVKLGFLKYRTELEEKS